MKLTIQTNEKGRLEVLDENGKPLENIGKIELYVTSNNKVSAAVEFKDVQLKLRVSS